jgi:hypothetical protein
MIKIECFMISASEMDALINAHEQNKVAMHVRSREINREQDSNNIVLNATNCNMLAFYEDDIQRNYSDYQRQPRRQNKMIRPLRPYSNYSNSILIEGILFYGKRITDLEKEFKSANETRKVDIRKEIADYKERRIAYSTELCCAERRIARAAA